MHKPHRILVTGNHGYIGSVMAPALARAGYDVVGLDTDYFMECTLIPDEVNIPTIVKDIRSITPADLRGFDAVIHLAALSNDPIGNLNADWTREINLDGSVRLAQMAKEAGIRRFLFSSSCIMYGMSGAETVDETSPLAPETEYARSKVKAEAALRELADDSFSPTYCRNGTIYGLSPRMRFDTVLNDLTGRAYTSGEVDIFSDGTPWRPVVHVRDVARAFQAILEAPLESVHDQAFNVGADHLNHQIRELAEIVADTVPGCRISFKHEAGADQRTYKARFGKFAATFPDFSFNWTARDGARELYESFKSNGLTAADFNDRRFTRLRWLRHLVDDDRVNGSLFWKEAAGQAA